MSNISFRDMYFIRLESLYLFRIAHLSVIMLFLKVCLYTDKVSHPHQKSELR